MMIEGVRIERGCAVEVTFRCHQQRLFLRPDRRSRAILLGCFGRALYRYPGLKIHVLSILSNHGSFVATPESPRQLADFMRDFLSTAALKLNLARGRDGTFWERRYNAIAITDNAKLEERFAYCLTQGTKENLVASARDWPGVSSVEALTGGPPLVGRWRDGTREAQLRQQRRRRIERAARSGRDIDEPEVQEVWLEYVIELAPLPHWSEWPAERQHAAVENILRLDDEATRERHERKGTRPLGVEAVLATHPFIRPENPKRSPAPVCHTSLGDRVYDAFRDARRAHHDAIQACAGRHAEAVREVGFPVHATAPPTACRPKGYQPPPPREPQVRIVTSRQGPPRSARLTPQRR